MKSNFQLSLSGKDWWKPFLCYWIPFLLVYIAETAFPRLTGVSSQTAPGAYLVVALLSMLLMIVLQAIFTILFLRIILPKLSIDGKSFGFGGDVGRYLGMNVGRFLLSLVTLFIYLPWYIRRITAYLVSETTFDGASPEFLGRGGKLFVYFLLSLLLPMVAVGVVYGIAVYSLTGGFATDAADALTSSLATLVVVVAIFVVLVPYFYLMYKWFANIRWNDVTISWKTRFWPSCGVILGQVLLTLVTVGIYWPAAVLRLYRYFAGATALSRGDVEIGRLGFEGDIGKGFGLLWGQALLCIITLGIYIPWGYARIGRWLASCTSCAIAEPGAASARSVPST